MNQIIFKNKLFKNQQLIESTMRPLLKVTAETILKFLKTLIKLILLIYSKQVLNIISDQKNWSTRDEISQPLSGHSILHNETNEHFHNNIIILDTCRNNCYVPEYRQAEYQLEGRPIHEEEDMLEKQRTIWKTRCIQELKTGPKCLSRLYLMMNLEEVFYVTNKPDYSKCLVRLITK